MYKFKKFSPPVVERCPEHRWEPPQGPLGAPDPGPRVWALLPPPLEALAYDETKV